MHYNTIIQIKKSNIEHINTNAPLPVSLMTPKHQHVRLNYAITLSPQKLLQNY